MRRGVAWNRRPRGIIRFLYSLRDPCIHPQRLYGDWPCLLRTLTQYDAVGNVTQVTDADTHSTWYRYDARNLRTMVIDA